MSIFVWLRFLSPQNKIKNGFPKVCHSVFGCAGGPPQPHIHQEAIIWNFCDLAFHHVFRVCTRRSKHARRKLNCCFEKANIFCSLNLIHLGSRNTPFKPPPPPQTTTIISNNRHGISLKHSFLHFVGN